MSEEENNTPAPTLLEQAELRKLQAETARADREAELFAAQAARATAETNRAAHENSMNVLRLQQEEIRLNDAKLASEMNKIRRNQAVAANHLKLHAEGGLGVFHFNREVSTDAKGFFGLSHGTVEPLIAKLVTYATDNEGKPITLIINSPGGGVDAGNHLIGELRTLAAKGHDITTIISGRAASMGGIIAQAGDKRLIRQGSRLMLHQVSGMMYGSAYSIEDELEIMKEVNDRIVTLYAERSGGKTSKDYIARKIDRKNWWMWAEEALERGFVDEIVGQMPGIQ